MENWEQTLAELATERGAALKRHASVLSGDDSQTEAGGAAARGGAPGPTGQVPVRDAMMTVLRGLSPRQRACLVLRYYEDLPVAEIAVALGVSEGAVKRYLGEATTSMAVRLSGTEGAEPEAEREGTERDGNRGRDLRSRLEEAAVRAEAPRFTAEDVAARMRRIRRRRRSRAWVAAAVVVAAVTPAVVIPLTSGGTGQGATGVAPPPAPDVSFAVAMNDECYAVPGPTGPGEYYVTPGQNLTITVDVDVPTRTQVTALSIGISDGLPGPR